MKSIALIAGIESFYASIEEVGEDRPEQAYILAVELSKMADAIKKKYSDKFRAYYDEQKELPGGFQVKISNRKTYKYEENEEWAMAKANLEFIESQIKLSTDNNTEFPNPRTGLYIKPVRVGTKEIYSLSRK